MDKSITKFGDGRNTSPQTTDLKPRKSALKTTFKSKEDNEIVVAKMKRCKEENLSQIRRKEFKAELERLGINMAFDGVISSNDDIIAKVPAAFNKSGEETAAIPEFKKGKLDCLKCISHDRAIYLIVLFDIFSGFCLVPIVKSVAANKFSENVDYFPTYIKHRFCSLVVELSFAVLLALGVINIVYLKKLGLKIIILVIIGLSAVLVPVFLL